MLDNSIPDIHPVYTKLTMFHLAPVVSVVLAYAAIIHSLCLFFFRYNSCEHESVAIAIASLVVDAMTIPLTHYFIYFKWQAVSEQPHFSAIVKFIPFNSGLEYRAIVIQFIPHNIKL